MIIYGTKNKELAKAVLTDKCPNCGKQNTIDMHVFQKYAHIFWIPFFPLGKSGVSQCDHCKQVLKLKEMPESLKASYEAMESQSKTPIWTFSGIAVIVVIVVIGIIMDKQKGEKNAKLILNPQSGDIFEIRTNDKQFTLFKVENVVGDSVFIHPNNYESNSKTGLSDLRKKGFSEDVLGFSKAELKKMVDDGDILDIER